MTLDGARTGFGRTLGIATAVAVVVCFVVVGWMGLRWARRANEALQSQAQHAADSARTVYEAHQRANDAQLKQERQASARAVQEAMRATARAEAGARSRIAPLEAQVAQRDSLLAAGDTVRAIAAAPPLTVDSAAAFLRAQWHDDSLALAKNDSASRALERENGTLRSARATADSIAATWHDKFDAEVKKAPPFWQRVARTAFDVAVVVLAVLVVVNR